ncbi:TonB-dependent receptor [Sphingomonas sp.]|uniref:TonB-dependent siderophore receptor n=1 Tax=Sphingomonas sp. TaxID=28214 RepID=UPI0025FE1609|nr:TonB-dependent receptor [Sphingomonas sp.]
MITSTRGQSRRAIRIAALALTALTPGLIVATPALAQSAPDRTYDLDIPAQSLATSLTALSSATGLQVVYTDNEPLAVNVPALKGRMTIDEALARLTAGTGFTYRFTAASVVTLVKLPADASRGGERVLGAVRVQGAQGGASELPGSSPVNGINGSRDVTATEGTGSYTSNALTVGSKTAASIKDTPMSVSVLTNQQMQDQNITDLNGAMRNLPGVTITTGNSADELRFFSRGFQITQIQFDGGAPMLAGGYSTNYTPIIDLSLFDHIELVRGASGTFNAYGDPGGVINLVRKKPLDHQQFLLDMQIGSWDWHRISVDLTGPLAFDGKLRGRFIATHQDNNFFYKIAKANRNVLSGTLEYDLTSTTLVSAGFNYQDSHDLPFSNGLMRYENGEPLGLPRSTCFCFYFAKADTENKEWFGQIEQRLGNQWTLKLKGTRITQTQVTIRPGVTGSVNPYTLLGAGAYPSSFYYGHERQTLFEATIDGKFRLFGQDQKIVIGGNYSMENPAGTTNGLYADLYTLQPLQFTRRNSAEFDAFHFNANEWGDPIIPGGYSSKILYGDNRYLNTYVSLELTPIKHLHLSTSIRYSEYRNRGLGSSVCYAIFVTLNRNGCGTKKTGDLVVSRVGTQIGGGNFSWPPSVQWRYDLSDNVTVSAIYTDIYINQSSQLDIHGNPTPPITGGNFEGMIKWQPSSRKLNATLSGYYTKQNGYLYVDPACSGSTRDPRCTDSSTTTTPGELDHPTSCCFVFDPTRANISYGTDLEVQGEIRKGWQLSASYNFNYNYVKGGKLFDGQRQPLTAFAPRHRFQFWTSYTFDEGSRFKGLYLGFGAQAQSKTFVTDSYCTAYVPDPNSDIPGAQRCADNASVPVNFTDPGRVILSGSIGYKVNDTLRLDLQMENLLDKTYYETVGGIGGGNFYGSPRSFKLSLHGKW